MDSLNNSADVYFRLQLQPSASHANVAPPSYFSNSHQCIFFFSFTTASSSLLSPRRLAGSLRGSGQVPPSLKPFGNGRLAFCGELFGPTRCVIYGQSLPHKPHTECYKADWRGRLRSQMCDDVGGCLYESKLWCFTESWTLSLALSISGEHEVNMHSRLCTTAPLLLIPHGDALWTSGDSMRHLDDETPEQATKRAAFLVKTHFPNAFHFDKMFTPSRNYNYPRKKNTKETPNCFTT